MAQYMLSVHTGAHAEPRPQMTEEQMQKSWQTINALEEDMKSSGAFVLSARLHPPDTASVVRVADGKTLTTDGPFIEAKEHLGGFYLIAAEDLDAALAWAGKVTAAVGMPIEVRPLWEAPGA
jgi:hypothetical protein